MRELFADIEIQAPADKVWRILTDLSQFADDEMCGNRSYVIFDRNRMPAVSFFAKNPDPFCFDPPF